MRMSLDNITLTLSLFAVRIDFCYDTGDQVYFHAIKIQISFIAFNLVLIVLFWFRRYVIDSGFVKQKSYDPNTGMDALLVVPISQAAATQRAGRAGRTAPGKAYRLYCRESYEQMDEETIPEIQRSSLLGTVLSLKKMGIQDIINFEFIDPPDPLLVTNALRQLFLLEAIDASGRLTSLGTFFSETIAVPHNCDN